MLLSRKILQGVFVSVAICLGGHAAASEATAQAEALACFQEGKALFKKEQYNEAAAKFREAYELKPSWKLFFNIGQSEAAGKRHGLALEAFERFLSEGGDDIIETRRDQVLYEVERLRKIVGFLKVKAPEGTTVFVDDVVRGTAPVLMALPVAVGKRHEVWGESNSKRLEGQAFRVTGGQTVLIELKGGNEPPPDKAAAPTVESVPQQAEPMDVDGAKGDEAGGSTPEKRRSPLIVSGWALASGGAALAIVGGVLGGVALSKNSSLVDDCSDEPCPELSDDKTSRDRVANVSTGLIAAGGTVLAAGVAMIFIGKKRQKGAEQTVSMVPFFNRETAAAAFEWRF